LSFTSNRETVRLDTWHGKGSHDGLGAAVKRAIWTRVLQGREVKQCRRFLQCCNNRCSPCGEYKFLCRLAPAERNKVNKIYCAKIMFLCGNVREHGHNIAKSCSDRDLELSAASQQWIWVMLWRNWVKCQWLQIIFKNQILLAAHSVLRHRQKLQRGNLCLCNIKSNDDVKITLGVLFLKIEMKLTQV
jgi:hypothetical protein